MTPRLTEIHINEVLVYLGYKGGEIDAKLMEDIERCADLLMRTAVPRVVWRKYSLYEELPLALQGNDVKKLLSDSREVVFMCATLGAETELLLRKTQSRSMADAVILDCCASSAIENVCDNFCADLEKELGAHLTDRFSPGYGDMPLTQQTELCALLNTARTVGVTLTPGGLMLPQKSVTAVMGVSDNVQKKRPKGCAYCKLFGNCEISKEGGNCGK